MAMQDNGQLPAVWVDNVHKSYGRGHSKTGVLKGLCMTVQQGAIYGLLGPSGCGKTTLLRCIVGRLGVDEGRVVVLGNVPGARGHGIPGRQVGYMPQEMALYQKFTISDTMTYFGHLHGMTRTQIGKRIDFLLDFLTLPDKHQMVEQLSGGQKRRVSLASALLQEPELLILDEPTVGVDPVLREKIWEHLLQIAQNMTRTTIIITTHYIEEARQASCVGLMRDGRLLAEDKPETLMHKLKINSLELVFLHLCHRDQQVRETERNSQDVMFQDSVQDSSFQPTSSLMSPTEKTPLLSHSAQEASYQQQQNNVKFVDPAVDVVSLSLCTCLPRCRNIAAVFVKNVTILKRNIGFLLFEFILPSIQIVLFCLCIGRDPFNLHVGIVNHDTGVLGKMFLSNLDNDSVHQIPYENLSAALDTVRQGNSWGVLAMGQNFSTDILLRFSDGPRVDNATLNGSSIQVYLDMTNQQISIMLQQKIDAAFQKFAHTMLEGAGLNPQIASLPIKIEQPIYGNISPSFTNFMAPGIIISITFFMATGLTTMVFITEKREGLLDRSQVAGLKTIESMIAHISTQFLVLIVQVALLLVFAIVVFKVPYLGPLIWVIILALLQGFCGMTLGMVFSVVCDKEESAIQLALGSVYPMLLLSGVIWPIEAIPEWLRYISVCLPMTYASEAMRSVLSRGWDITAFLVWRGYLITIGWSTGLLLLAAVILRIKQ
ncbi:ABC transporter G family member 20-like isoform X1 [Gigantopelta aegis]|uniref:ABC transporter G family member 20-like isoform X1 n=1 Tax=Gigantopelta aegis TaxID=1735272 RepID=UPI001B88A0C9|nr:ABC transporter G family member 20-like isoform X1 [Gigantopelta aegis]